MGCLVDNSALNLRGSWLLQCMGHLYCALTRVVVEDRVGISDSYMMYSYLILRFLAINFP